MPDGLQDFTYGEAMTSVKLDKVAGQCVVDLNAASESTTTMHEGGMVAVIDQDRFKVQTAAPAGTTFTRLLHYSSAGRTGAACRRVASQSVASGSEVAISWDTEDSDSDAYIVAHATTGTTFTVPAGLGGLYVGEMMVDYASDPSSATSWLGWKVVRSGVTEYMAGWGEMTSSAAPTGNVYGGPLVVTLSAGDTVQVIARQGTGAAINVTGRVGLWWRAP